MLSDRQSFCWTLWSSSADLSSSNNNNNNDNPINVSACQWAGDNKSTHCISSMQTQNCTNRLNFLHRETNFLDNVFTTQRLDYKTLPNLHVCDHIKKNTASLVSKSQQRLSLQTGESKSPTPNKSTFYRGTVESILTNCITVWYGSGTGSCWKKLQWVVRAAEMIVGTSLPSTQLKYGTGSWLVVDGVGVDVHRIIKNVQNTTGSAVHVYTLLLTPLNWLSVLFLNGWIDVPKGTSTAERSGSVPWIS